MNFIPMVITQGERWEYAYDIYSMLLSNRVIFLGDGIDDHTANLIVAQLLFLNRDGSQQPIHMYINSAGGDIYSGLAIYDTMQLLTSPLYTYAVGRTASISTLLLAAGSQGHRYTLPHATMHMHPVASGATGYTNDMRIAFREQERRQTQLFQLLGRHTGHAWQEIEQTFTRDRWFNAVEAKTYGLVDHVLGDMRDIVLRVEAGQLVLEGSTATKLSIGQPEQLIFV